MWEEIDGPGCGQKWRWCVWVTAVLTNGGDENDACNSQKENSKRHREYTFLYVFLIWNIYILLNIDLYVICIPYTIYNVFIIHI